MLKKINGEKIQTLSLDTNILVKIANDPRCINLLDNIITNYDLIIPSVVYSEFNLGNTTEKENKLAYALQGFVPPSLDHNLLKQANQLLDRYMSAFCKGLKGAEKKKTRNEHRNDIQIFHSARYYSEGLVTEENRFEQFNNVLHTENEIIGKVSPYGNDLFRLPIFTFDELEKSFMEEVTYIPKKKQMANNRQMGLKDATQSADVTLDFDPSRPVEQQGFTQIFSKRQQWDVLKRMVVDQNYHVALATTSVGGKWYKEVIVSRHDL